MYRAKDIQKILGIPKFRYEYLAGKMQIRPELEEVEGQGRAHVYSFRNLLEFAFVNVASAMGLSPKNCGRLLAFVRFIDKTYEVGIFAEGEGPDLSVHFVVQGGHFFHVTGESKGTGINQGWYPVEGFLPNLLKRYTAGEGTPVPSGPALEVVSFPGEGVQALEPQKRIQAALKHHGNAEAVLTINLGIIKANIRARI
jgi:hypothetical protein